MALDISAYRKVTPVRPQRDADDDGHEEKLTRFTNNKDFAGRFKGLEERTLYSYEGYLGFRAGSYGGYNRWREWLASLVGTTPAAVWKNPKPGPFVELINFSDCEGTIGPQACAKLARDFAEHDAKAKSGASEEDKWFYETYQQWRKGFELAADGGAVDFH